MKTLYLFLDPSDYAIPQVVWADDLKDGIDFFYKAYFGKGYPWEKFTEQCAKHEVYTLKPLSFLGVFENLI